MSAGDGTELPYYQKSVVLCCEDSSITNRQRDLGIYYGVLILINAGHSENTREIYQKASVCLYVLKLLCSAQPQVISPAEDEAAVQRLSPSAPALTMPDEHNPTLPDSNTQEEHTVRIRIKRTNRMRTTHLLLRHEGILSLRDTGSFLEHLAKKKSVAQQLLKQCSGRRELPDRLTQ